MVRSTLTESRTGMTTFRMTELLTLVSGFTRVAPMPPGTLLDILLLRVTPLLREVMTLPMTALARGLAPQNMDRWASRWCPVLGLLVQHPPENGTQD